MDSAQSSQPEMAKHARVQVAHPMLAMMGMLIGVLLGCFRNIFEYCFAPVDGAVNVSTATIQWLVTGYMLMVGVVLPPPVLLRNGLRRGRLSCLP